MTKTGRQLPARRETSQLAERPTQGSVWSFMSAATRSGAWRPPEQLTVNAYMGSVVLDFRKALLGPGETIVDVFSMMGSVEIIVPDDIHVETDGSGFLAEFGSFSQRAADPDAPLLRVEGSALMGSIEVKTEPTDPALPG